MFFLLFKYIKYKLKFFFIYKVLIFNFFFNIDCNDEFVIDY